MTVVAECSERGLADEKAWPPGFRFHPTDEELVLYYLKRKICRRKIKLDIIGETDVYKWDPEELPGISLLKTGDRQWFFFSPRDRKYPNAARSNRATRHGYWKATGKDRNITCNSRNVGVKKTLVFYKGRAPSGERTDWVMHEYTLDEEELKRCQNAQDYYALYKVYKKSGPGPKNGEQYGAPFKEEEWAEDGYQDFNNSGDREIQVAKLTEAVTSLNDNKENGQALSSLEDLEEFMKRIADEPLLDFPVVDDSAFSLPLVVYQEDTKSTIDPYYQDPSESPPVTGTNRIDQQCDAQESFDHTQSARSQLQFYEASSEVTSAFEFSEQVPQIIQEEDFLEMDDLIGPEPTFSSTENPLENLHFEVERDGLGELDLFHDANMFLQDLGQYSIDHGTVSDFYLNERVNNNYSMSYQSNQDQENGINNQMQMHDQTSNVFMVSESHEQSLTLPNSGVLYESSNLVAKNNEDNGPEGGSSMGRFSSSLWAFVESIPTTPASASENAHRAFERMSSFSRIRLMNGKFPNGNAGIAIENRRECRNRGFFYFFSLLGVLCAILGVLIGSFRLWGGRISM